MNPLDKYSVEDLIRIRNAMKTMLDLKFFGTHGHEAALRVFLNLQQALLSRKVSLLTEDRWHICTKKGCYQEIDKQQGNWHFSSEEGYRHKDCPEMKSEKERNR